MKSIRKTPWIIPALLLAGTMTPAAAAEEVQEAPKKDIKELEEIVVSAQSGAQGIVLSPTDTVIKTEQFNSKPACTIVILIYVFSCRYRTS